jgi:hypothetical protein
VQRQASLGRRGDLVPTRAPLRPWERLRTRRSLYNPRPALLTPPQRLSQNSLRLSGLAGDGEAGGATHQEVGPGRPSSN